MPSESRQQQKLMRAAAKSPEVAKRTGVPQSVAREFVKADQARGSVKLPQRVKHSKGK